MTSIAQRPVVCRSVVAPGRQIAQLRHAGAVAASKKHALLWSQRRSHLVLLAGTQQLPRTTKARIKAKARVCASAAVVY
jgi:hypothetical protein